MAFAVSVLNVFLASIQSLHSLRTNVYITHTKMQIQPNGIVKMVFGVFVVDFFAIIFPHSFSHPKLFHSIFGQCTFLLRK